MVQKKKVTFLIHIIARGQRGVTGIDGIYNIWPKQRVAREVFWNLGLGDQLYLGCNFFLPADFPNTSVVPYEIIFTISLYHGVVPHHCHHCGSPDFQCLIHHDLPHCLHLPPLLDGTLSLPRSGSHF